jgi:hypothetical protein
MLQSLTCGNGLRIRLWNGKWLLFIIQIGYLEYSEIASLCVKAQDVL